MTMIDSKVIQALENLDLWNTHGTAVSRRGYFTVRADELARYLNVSQDAVVKSLSRLAASGNLRNIGGTAEDDTPSLSLRSFISTQAQNYTFRKDGRAVYSHYKSLTVRPATAAEIEKWLSRQKKHASNEESTR